MVQKVFKMFNNTVFFNLMSKLKEGDWLNFYKRGNKGQGFFIDFFGNFSQYFMK